MSHDHRALAVALYNGTWDLLEKPERTAAEDHLMLHRAHASLWHWLQVGTHVHHQRGAWMVARIYAELGWVQPARAFADEARTLLTKDSGDFADFDRAFMTALEARVAAAAGDGVGARQHLADARDLRETLDDDDRKVFDDQLAAGAWHGFDPAS